MSILPAPAAVRRVGLAVLTVAIGLLWGSTTDAADSSLQPEGTQLLCMIFC